MRGALRVLIELLFPIQRYVRLRREVGFGRALGAAVLVLVVAAMPEYLRYLRWAGLGSFERIAWTFRWAGPGGVARAWLDASGRYLWDMVTLHGETLIFWAFAAAVAALELWVALIFVRRQPGRRRPLCTWQTFKYVLLGAWSWFLLIALCVVLGPLWGALIGVRPPWENVALGTLIVALVGAPLLLAGATAAQAANAVVARQDDRKCKICGYFLIGLSEPRCPECGTVFDPATLATLAVPPRAEVG